MQTQLSTPTFGDDRLPPRFWAKVRLGSVPAHRPDLGPCWEWRAARDGKGYGYFMVASRTNGGAKMIYAHRLAYERLIGPIASGLESDHLCRNHACVRATHIEPVSHLENIRRGSLLRARGEANGRAKLTEAQVREIRRLQGTITQRSLAAQFEVSQGNIHFIQSGKHWRHV